MPNDKASQYVLWFDEIGIEDIPYVGGKNASLGEMYTHLNKKGIHVPNGFAVTAHAYQTFIKQSGLEDVISAQMKSIDTHNIESLQRVGQSIRQAILGANVPEAIKQEIVDNYKKLSKEYSVGAVDVAVRSSATAEDLPEASFAGQQETYLNVVGEYHILESVKKCFASLFTNRAISYRADKGFDHFGVSLSVTVQKMVRSDKASSGVMFTIDTESGFPDVVVINSSYGLGENVVKGIVNPDQFYVFKTTFAQGFEPIIGRFIGTKREKMVYTVEGSGSTKNVPVSEKDARKQSITDEEVLQLAKWGMEIEEYYSKQAGHPKPMDIEWAKDGRENKLYIVQARPETVHAVKEKHVLETFVLKKTGKVLSRGLSIGQKIGAGKAHVIKDVEQIAQFKKGEVLVTEVTDPDWEPIMKIASAIVTNSGGRTSHAAIVSRELGIPCVVGALTATETIPDGKDVTVSCAGGEEGVVFEGSLPFEIKTTNLKGLKKPKTQVMMNIGDPDQAFLFSQIPNSGVGLAREEFIISSFIRVHPLALLQFDEITDSVVRAKIEEITTGYAHKPDFFVDKLAEGISRLAAAFYPKDVIVRTSDFKTNEYASLLGGKQFEPNEENPMIGYRGASRYYDERFAKAFALECEALKQVRDKMGLTNVKIMIPFCRTIEEAEKVIAIMKKHGLERGKNGLELYVMVEIPSNVILAEEFAAHFDGFSIGSNDLTQLVLGVDRDSTLVNHVYDEQNEAVKSMIRQVIRVARKTGTKIGICGQAPSDFPEFAEFLVEEGIDSISLNPDTVIKTSIRIEKAEQKRKRKRTS
jgi:pyruvate, water dikinase